jgi:hypothetical protein
MEASLITGGGAGGGNASDPVTIGGQLAGIVVLIAYEMFI